MEEEHPLADAPQRRGAEFARAGGGFVAEADPGDVVVIKSNGKEVTITAEVKRDWEKKEGDKMLRSERYYGNVYRSFTLPYELDGGARPKTDTLRIKVVPHAITIRVPSPTRASTTK